MEITRFGESKSIFITDKKTNDQLAEIKMQARGICQEVRLQMDTIQVQVLILPRNKNTGC